MSVDLYPDTLPETVVDLMPTPARYTWTFISDSPDMGAGCLCFFKGEGFATRVIVVDVKLERGNVAMDWSEAPGDIPGLSFGVLLRMQYAMGTKSEWYMDS